MTQFKPITFDGETLRKYWEGPENKFSRYYTYLQKGFGLFNETKNYFLILFTTYWTIKTMDYWVSLNVSDVILMTGLGILALVGIGFLILIGRWDLFVLSKAREFAMVQNGSVTQYNGYNMQVRIVEQNDEIIKLLKQLNDNNSR